MNEPICDFVEEKTSEEYEEEFKLLNQMFPNALFEISIPIEKIENLITDLKEIYIGYDYTCNCYETTYRSTDYFYIKGERLTYKYVINELIKQGLNFDCNHNFLEGINPNTNKANEFLLVVGS